MCATPQVDYSTRIKAHNTDAVNPSKPNTTASARLEGAREASRSRALLAIKEAGRKDWRAHHAWLLLTSPDHKPVKQNIVASVQVDNSIRSQICTPEKLERIRELRRNAMANQNLTRSDD